MRKILILCQNSRAIIVVIFRCTKITLKFLFITLKNKLHNISSLDEKFQIYHFSWIIERNAWPNPLDYLAETDNLILLDNPVDVGSTPLNNPADLFAI